METSVCFDVVAASRADCAVVFLQWCCRVDAVLTVLMRAAEDGDAGLPIRPDAVIAAMCEEACVCLALDELCKRGIAHQIMQSVQALRMQALPCRYDC